jgi:uncharacterized sulfatase
MAKSLSRTSRISGILSPTRHALYTGLFPVHSGAYPNHTMVDKDTKSVFTYLKAAGYRVGLQEKKHISPASSLTIPPWMHDDAQTRKALAAYYAEVSQHVPLPLLLLAHEHAATAIARIPPGRGALLR